MPEQRVETAIGNEASLIVNTGVDGTWSIQNEWT